MKQKKTSRLHSCLYFVQSKIRAFRSDLGTSIKKRKTIVYIMQFYNVRLLGSLAAFALVGVNPGQAQTPANVSGGFAEFTPTINLSSLQTTANGLTHNTA